MSETGATTEVLLDGLCFGEGPRWHRGALWLSDMHAHQVLRVVHGPRSAFELAKVAGADVFAVKIEQSGGLYAAQQVAAIADAAGIELYGGTMLEGAVGTIASAHAFATFANLQWGTELFGPLLLTEEILETPLDYSDFHLTVPDGPGLGTALDEDRVQFFRRDRAARAVSISNPSNGA